MGAVRGTIESLSYRDDGRVKGIKMSDGMWYNISSKTELPSFTLREGMPVELEVGNKNWVDSIRFESHPKNGNGTKTNGKIDDLEKQIIISRLSLLSTAKDILSLYPDRITDDPVRDAVQVAKGLEKYVFAHLAKNLK